MYDNCFIFNINSFLNTFYDNTTVSCGINLGPLEIILNSYIRCLVTFFTNLPLKLPEVIFFLLKSWI